jgi:hypothetical protein
MTLSNFSWTDKKTVKWFILLPTGHEGPYSLDTIIAKNIGKDLKIWAEGLSDPLPFKKVLELASRPENSLEDEEMPPPLPPLPVEEALDVLPVKESEILTVEESRFKYTFHLALLAALLIISILGVREWIQSKEEFAIRRLPKMSPELHQRIMNDFSFAGWDKKIFFKEYVSPDMSQIWLVTAGFQRCEVEALFSGIEGKLLSQQEEKVSFRSKAPLKGHVAEFSAFEFIEGSRIIPGLYEVDIKADNCVWDGSVVKLANRFSSPEPKYLSRMKVVLYPKGSAEFNEVLDRFLRKKMEAQQLSQNKEELFWQDLQQKLQTLLAITLQIEQLMTDFMEQEPESAEKNLKLMVDTYTKNFGHFLTNFVVANEEYFKQLAKLDLPKMSSKKNYELMIRTTSKLIGHDSMKIIEELQSLKKISNKDLQVARLKTSKVFEQIKDNINRKIIQVTEDRSKISP